MKNRTIPLVLLLLSFVSFTIAQTTYTNFDDFKSAIEKAQAGDEIVLKDGVYTSRSITIKEAKGTPEAPIIIRAENIGGATLNNGTYFDFRNCSYVTIQGFNINISEKSTTFKLQASNHIRITQNTVDGSSENAYKDNGTDRNSAVWVSIQGLWDDDVTLSHHNRIDHNVFQNKQTLGNMIKIDGTNEKLVSQYDVIEYNYFKNMGPRAENEMEAIRIGWSAMSESDGFCTVSNNLFEACNGDPEIISVKCNKNTIAHNTFRRCQGTLSLRHGNASVVEGNFFLGEGAEGTGGVRIYGSDHKIINNYFEGLTGTKWDAPITLTEGDAEEGNSGLTKHFRIERAIIANNTLINNTHGIEIGYDNQGKYSKPPRDVIMAYNVVSASVNVLVNYINSPDHMQWVNNIMYATGTASLGQGVSFSDGEVMEQDPKLAMHASLKYYKASANTPSYTPMVQVAGNIPNDIDGQLRNLPTQYGADEYSSAPVTYRPLEAKDVGPSRGAFLYVAPSAINFSVHPDTTAIQIQSNLNWTVSKNVDWISIDKGTGSSDGVLQVIALNNETGLVRTAEISISSTNSGEASEITQSISVTQRDKETPMLQVEVSELNFSAESGIEEVGITSNVKWTISGDAAWLGFFPSNGSNDGMVAISVEANPSLSKRTAIATVTNGASLSQTIQITQSGATGTEEKLTILSAVASTEQSGNEAFNTIDGNLSNRWSGEGDGANVVLDLGSLKQVSYLNIGLYKGNSRTSTFDILTSVDGEIYTEALMNVTTEVTEEKMVLYDFENRDARYIKFVGHGNSSSAWNSYTEFEVWGWNAPTGVRKTFSGDALFISPNPNSGSFALSQTHIGMLTIYGLDGSVVYQTVLHGDNVVDSGLKTGTYIAVIQTKAQQLYQKIQIK